MAVLLQTSLGELTIDLFIDQVPTLAANFLKLCKLKKYNNTLFYSVEKNFIARAGIPWTPSAPRADPDPHNPGQSILSIIREQNPAAFRTIVFPTRENTTVFSRDCCDNESGQLCESFHPKLRHNKRGIVAMANEKTNQIGSTFYITLRDTIDFLDNKRSIIGVITEGFDVLDKINDVIVEDPTGNRPLKPIRIFHTLILDDPFEDPYGMEQPPKSPIIIETDVMEMGGDTVEDEIAALEKLAKSEARSRAVALEILGDLPDAEMAPPDNVLFVCKLNPITEAEDLELIFSR